MKQVKTSHLDTARWCSAALISNSRPSARHQPKLQDHRHGASVSHSFCCYQFVLLGNRGTWVWTTC